MARAASEGVSCGIGPELGRGGVDPAVGSEDLREALLPAEQLRVPRQVAAGDQGGDVVAVGAQALVDLLAQL